MTPKKTKEFYKIVADRLGLDVDIVERVVDHYWSNVRKTLENPKSPYLRIEELGYFRIRPVRLIPKIKQREKYLAYLGNLQDYKKFDTYARVSEELKKYKMLYDKIVQDLEDRKKFKQENYNKLVEQYENHKTNCSDN